MKVVNLGAQNSLFNEFVREIRDVNIQGDRMRFRRNLERMGEVFAYELSKQLEYEEIEVTTPLGVAKMNVLKEQPVLATILRAGLPLHQGLLNYFDKADNTFVSAYRKHEKDGTFEIELEYLASPSLEGRTVIISDPMLATGSSMVVTYKALLHRGTPKQIFVVAALASVQGLEYAKRNLPENTKFYVGAIDDELTAQAYIVPGLGDAGDLAFGSKE
ncbi:MAG TPA: uracil phosphoribosyltransferase [Flavobacteriales bacterium]|nr:uracil phosphoribosyltransferase [Flavobacteriales bacterium]|tara:strand:+ start:40795 stop:41445 length:651 start_codon:yes stop_codon:yes gene_type:complete